MRYQELCQFSYNLKLGGPSNETHLLPKCGGSLARFETHLLKNKMASRPFFSPTVVYL